MQGSELCHLLSSRAKRLSPLGFCEGCQNLLCGTADMSVLTALLATCCWQREDLMLSRAQQSHLIAFFEVPLQQKCAGQSGSMWLPLPMTVHHACLLCVAFDNLKADPD